MNDWRTALRNEDPAAHAQLRADEVQSMRRAVLSAVPSPAAAPRRLWMQPLLVAATIALMIGTGSVAGWRAAHGVRGRETVAVEPGREQTRQLQFATPGGTRIIWVFNSDFDRNESIP